MDISIIGSGNVGERIGKNFSESGHKLIFYDIRESAFKNLGDHKTTLDIYETIRESIISFIAVPTEIDEATGQYNYNPLRETSLACGKALKKEEYHVFVIKSTVTPGATEDVIIPRMEEASGKRAGEDFGVVYNPEFLTVIENTWANNEKFRIDPSKEGRIVLGEGHNKKAGDIVEKFYNETILENFLENVYEDKKEIIYRKSTRPVPVFRTDYKTAEMTKLVANNRLPLATSYTNEIFLFAEELKKAGIEVDMKFIAKMVAKDHRIGEYGSTYDKAWGGPCFKKDTVSFRAWLEKTTGRKTQLVNSTIEINEEMKEKFGVRE